ncbi:hypothetical protein KC354_g126 [Hortaea werneckii]|nr:hypothetical protein KC354_g126 [Hortaea werneckii]
MEPLLAHQRRVCTSPQCWCPVVDLSTTRRSQDRLKKAQYSHWRRELPGNTSASLIQQCFKFTSRHNPNSGASGKSQCMLQHDREKTATPRGFLEPENQRSDLMILPWCLSAILPRRTVMTSLYHHAYGLYNLSVFSGRRKTPLSRPTAQS